MKKVGEKKRGGKEVGEESKRGKRRRVGRRGGEWR